MGVNKASTRVDRKMVWLQTCALKRVTGPTRRFVKFLSSREGSCKWGSNATLSDWTQMTLYVGAGSQVIQWVYTRYSMPAYSDAGWVDQVVYTPGAVAPELALEPAGQSQIQGWNATFAATCAGTPAFTYQWRCNGTNIPGATAAAYTITNVQPDRVGHYSVAVTNEAGGVVSADAPLVLGRIATWGLTSPAPPDLTNALAVAAGGLHRVALRPEHTVAAWGYNAYHQTEAPGELTNAVAVAAGDHFSMALKNDGRCGVGRKSVSIRNSNNVPQRTHVIAIAGGCMPHRHRMPSGCNASAGTAAVSKVAMLR